MIEMGRRSDHTRGELEAMLIEEGGRQLAEVGLARFSARDLAKRIGYSIGTLYNVFASLDELLMAINGRTLTLWADHLRARLAAAGDGDRIAALVRGYFEFAQAHPKTWIAIDGSAPSPTRISPTRLAQVRTLLSTTRASAPGTGALIVPWFKAASREAVRFFSGSTSGTRAESSSVLTSRSSLSNRWSLRATSGWPAARGRSRRALNRSERFIRSVFSAPVHPSTERRSLFYRKLCGHWDGSKEKTSPSSAALRRIGSNGCPNSQRNWRG